MTRRTWLPEESWELFLNLFDKVEGTEWADTRQLALDLISSSEVRAKLEEDKANITTILQMVHAERSATNEAE